MRRFIQIGLLVLVPCFQVVSAADNARPTMTVDGAGFFKNRLLNQQLETIFQEQGSFFGPADIEDAALIIVSSVQGDGFLEAKATSKITNANGESTTITWDSQLDVILPRETEGLLVQFEVTPGPKFYYASLTAELGNVISLKEVEAFFYSEPYFFSGDEAKVFTPALMTSSAQNLQSHLKTLGYQDARVVAEVVEMDQTTGATQVKVTIEEGPLYSLKEVIVKPEPDENEDNKFSQHLGKPYNSFLRQDIIQEIRNEYYSSGYANVQFEHKATAIPNTAQRVDVTLEISIIPGSQYTISNIEFEGAETIRRTLLKNQITFQEGDFHDPTKLDSSRLNLSRLGLFQKIDYELEDLGENMQALKFTLKDRTNWELNTLFGWGSYEELRVGIQAEKMNALGLGHRLRFKTIASSKSLLGETRYLIPNFLELDIPFSTKLFFLQRDELSFDREEFGINFGTSKYLQFLDMTVDAVYNFEALDARITNLGSSVTGTDNVRAGSFEIRFNRDKRDNPLNPQSGYRFFGDFEWASKALGGEVDYQSAEIGYSIHDEIKRGLLWHGAISHAVVGSFNNSQSQIPTNKLLYPGGENSIRGYERGGAAPRNVDGDFFGAKSYVLLNLELEQRLTNAISIVSFYDAVAMAGDIDDYPFDEFLSSVGLGIRFRTFMGPIRLEYGHNLNRRLRDPSGTYHLTIGYPF